MPAVVLHLPVQAQAPSQAPSVVLPPFAATDGSNSQLPPSRHSSELKHFTPVRGPPLQIPVQALHFEHFGPQSTVA